MPEDNKKKQTGLIAFGQGIKSFGKNYIPSGTSHIGWDASGGKVKSGKSFAWHRGLGNYEGRYKSQLIT